MAFPNVQLPDPARFPALERVENPLSILFAGTSTATLRNVKFLFSGMKHHLFVAALNAGMSFPVATQLSCDFKTDTLCDMAIQDHWLMPELLERIAVLNPSLRQPIDALRLHLRLTNCLAIRFGGTTGHVDGRRAWVAMLSGGLFSEAAMEECLRALSAPGQDTLTLMLTAATEELGVEASECIVHVLGEFVQMRVVFDDMV